MLLTMHSYFHLTFHAASTDAFFAFYLSSEPFLLNNKKNCSLAMPILIIPLSNAFADVESFVLAIHASSIEVFCVPQLY